MSVTITDTQIEAIEEIRRHCDDAFRDYFTDDSRQESINQARETFASADLPTPVRELSESLIRFAEAELTRDQENSW